MHVWGTTVQPLVAVIATKHFISSALHVYGPASLTAVQHALQIFMYAFIDVFPQIFQPKRQPPRATSGDKGNDRKPKVMCLPHQPVQACRVAPQPHVGFTSFLLRAKVRCLLLNGSSKLALLHQSVHLGP